jgi:hypothetical protein
MIGDGLLFDGMQCMQMGLKAEELYREDRVIKWWHEMNRGLNQQVEMEEKDSRCYTAV